MTTLFSRLRALERCGVELIREAHGTKPHQFPAIFSRGDVDTLIALARVLMGPTTAPARQRAVVTAAEANEHAWTTLAMIHKHAKRVPKTHQWDVWEKLVAMAGTYADIDAAGTTMVKEFAEPAPPRVPTHSYSSGDDGMTRGTYCIPTDRFHVFHENFRSPIADDSGRNIRRREGDALVEFLDSLGNAPQATKPRRVLVIGATLAESVKVLTGEGGHLKFGCSDGTIMTGAQLLNALPELDIFGGLFHPVKGPVSLNRLERSANFTQRVLMAAESVTCVRPGCGQPVDRCQPHHITAWKNGGPTNSSNIAPLCRRCNGRNDDTPGVKLHGRIERIDGIPQFVGPWPGAKPQMNTHPRAMLGLMHKLQGERPIAY